jgi:glycosyltransferase involved in cell wall biosynthesis
MTSDQRLPVMHVIDTLSAAGAERVAVNIVNHLPRDRYVPYLCTTRSDGPLDALVAPDVIRLRLQRGSRFDYRAIKTFRNFIKDKNIRLLHVHSSSLFIARVAALGLNVIIIWHAHYGRYATTGQFERRYRVGTYGIDGVMTVSEELAEWCSRRLGIPSEAVWYLPNPVSVDANATSSPVGLPGVKGSRIVCLANFRPEKDHFTLVKAMSRVVTEAPAAHLILVGKDNDSAYKALIHREISALGLEENVSILGARHDIAAVLGACDIGVLSSTYEGLPMSLLEYGVAGLAAVATHVGQCADVLDQGRVGNLVPPSSADELSRELISLLLSPSKRLRLAELFRKRVTETYSAAVVVNQVCKIYDALNKRERGCQQHAPMRCDASAI